MAMLALGLAWAAGITTQFVAWRLGYHPNLGLVLLRLDAHTARTLRWTVTIFAAGALLTLWRPAMRGMALSFLVAGVSAVVVGAGPLYPPYNVFVWYAAYRHVPALNSVFRWGWIVLTGAATLVSCAILSIVRRARRSASSDSHGSATWGGGEDLRRGSGLLLGRDADGTLLRYRGEGHLLTVAPTRSGKGTSCVIPNLLTYPGSVVVSDVKGELYAVTHRHRKDTLGTETYPIDPFGVVTDATASFNPLDLVDPALDTAIDNARLIADMLVVVDRRGGDSAFWDEEARSLLVGLILYVTAWADHGPISEAGTWSAPFPSGLPIDAGPVNPPQRTLDGVRQVLTAGPVVFQQHMERMTLWREWAHGLVARAADRLLQKAERERSGVVSCAQNHTHFLDSPRMVRVLDTSTVPLEALKQKALSIYVILPYERLDGYARWARLMIACSLIAVTRARYRAPERVLFLLDEFDALGPLSVVQRGIALTGGFGAAFWLFLQDLAQLKGTYPEKWGSFLANADVLQCFGANDLETAEYLSRLCGDATITIASENRSAGVSRGRTAARQEGSSVTISETARKLLLPDEVRRLPLDTQLLIVKGNPAILARRLNYLDDPEFTGWADPNPLYASAAGGVN
jgi:type IV secretion system protein VirD4